MENELLKKLLLLEKMSMNQLSSNTDVFFTTPRKQNSVRVQVTNIQFIPALESKTLLVKAKTRSGVSQYDTRILFENVQYVEFGALNSVEILGVDGNKYYIKSLKKSQSDIKVGCTCPDFYYMFSVWNDNAESLEGPSPEPYVKKTDSPPRNPERVPGVCKHLLKLGDVCANRKILK